MKVSSIQLEIVDQSKQNNLEYALNMVDRTPESDLILLPEIWPCGFFSFHRYRSDAEPMDGPTVRAFKEKARERQCHILMGSFVERENDNLFNTTILLNPNGEVVATYRKIHLFGYMSEEAELLTPGEDVVVADTPWGKSGLSTCYDLRFPELFRRMVDKNAKLFLVVSAWPLVRVEAWRLFNRARAHENLAYLFSCNCAGDGGGTPFAGHSMIVDPLGQVLVEAGESEEIITADIDPGMVDSVRSQFPALVDRVFR
jgi:predicted amidohydrolase